MSACKTQNCDREAHTRGWCATHYRRVMRSGSDESNLPLQGCAKTPEQRLEEKSAYIPMCGCRLWFGASVPFGYGVTFFQGKQQFAHRVAWQLERGAIPDGLLVLHECDMPECINTNHLFLGTQKNNMDDMARKGRAGWGHSNRLRGAQHPMVGNGYKGEQHPRAKLTQLEVNTIREIYKTGITQSNIASMFGVKQAQISSIIRGKSWV